jgi:hypothetical protein
VLETHGSHMVMAQADTTAGIGTLDTLQRLDDARS